MSACEAARYAPGAAIVGPVSCERVGHGGASALERANTLASFAAARRLGIDTIEFDVRAWRGRLVLAHTTLHARAGWDLTLRRALDVLARPEFDGIGFQVDVKHTGCEAAILDEIARADLIERTLLCSQLPAVVDAFRALDPAARVGISVGGRLARGKMRWGDWRRVVLEGLAGGRWDALMAHHRLIDAGLVEDVRARRARLYAWTVNDRGTIDALRRLGVHGITTADPRLFA
jgi:glycerophosphoryl diester phosphodiesterase